MKRAKDLMSYDLLTLTREQMVYHAFYRMDENQLRHIPVVDDEGQLIGMISDRDLKRRVHEAFNPEQQSFEDVAFMLQEAHEVMTPDPVFAYPETDVLTLVQMMLTHRISSVVILSPDSQKPEGIVTSTDILRMTAERLQADAASE